MPNALIVAKPAATPRCCGVDWGQQVVLLAPPPAIGLSPASLNQRGPLCFGQIMKPVRFVCSDSDINNCIFPFHFFQCGHFYIAVAIWPIRYRPSINFSWSFFTSKDPVKRLLVCQWPSNMLDLNPPPLLDYPVGSGLKLHHRRQVGRDSISGHNFGVDDPAKRPTKLFYGTKASKRIFVS